MKFTNKFNLPGCIADALQGDNYDLKFKPSNIMSVTDILKPPTEKVLLDRHKEELEEDVSERLWRIMGSAVHSVVEEGSDKGERIAEERWYLDLDTAEVFFLNWRMKPQGQKWYKEDARYISGRLDVYDGSEKALYDHKVMSAWSYILEDKKAKPEHTAQLNLNGFAVRKGLGLDVEKLGVIAIFRDHGKKFKLEHGIEIPIKEIPVPIWTDERVLDFAADRYTVHMEARGIEDEKLPACSPDDRWARPTTFAVKKPGRQSAVKAGFVDRASAEDFAADQGPTYFVEERPGANGKCEEYCSACTWCTFWKTTYGKAA